MASFADLPKELREMIAEYYRKAERQQLKSARRIDRDESAMALSNYVEALCATTQQARDCHLHKADEHCQRADNSSTGTAMHNKHNSRTRNIRAAKLGIDARALVIKKAQRKK